LRRISRIAVAVAHLVEHCTIVELEATIAGGFVARREPGDDLPHLGRRLLPIGLAVGKVAQIEREQVAKGARVARLVRWRFDVDCEAWEISSTWSWRFPKSMSISCSGCTLASVSLIATGDARSLPRKGRSPDVSEVACC
jgi:hypothetical protein